MGQYKPRDPMAPKTKDPDLSHIVEALRPLAVPISSIIPDPENARLHPFRNVETIKQSIVTKGQDQPVVVRKEDMMLSKGHGRLQAMKELGYAHIAAVVVEESRLSAVERGLIDNRASDLAETDTQALASLFAFVEENEGAVYGWDPTEMAEIFAASEAMASEAQEISTDAPASTKSAADEDPLDDEIPEPPAEPTTKIGDVIDLGRHRIVCGDCIEEMRKLPENSVDAIVTDPPYGLSPDGRARTWDDLAELRKEGKGPKVGFMGKAWDAGVPGVTWAAECFRVLKPGGHIAAFSATRTVHRLAAALEDVGFEIRDQLSWIYGSGFPKSTNVAIAFDKAAGEMEHRGVGVKHMVGQEHMATPGSVGAHEPISNLAKQWDGWGTALKPACEPICLARKPLVGTIVQNIEKYGTGALNIAACRVGNDGGTAKVGYDGGTAGVAFCGSVDGSLNGSRGAPVSGLGRWPANVLLDEQAAQALDEQPGVPEGASRFFYCAKAHVRERDEGLDGARKASAGELCNQKEGAKGLDSPRAGAGRTSSGRANLHPTVKPVALMRWLTTLVTPPGGTVLEPFLGSGTTMVAACSLDCSVIGFEREPAYCDISRSRVASKLERTK